MVSTNPKSWATLPRRVSALALAGVVAFANVPAVALAQGASVPAQTHAMEDAATMVSIRFIGPGADGEPVLYAALEDQGIPAGLTAADVTRAALANSGLTYDVQTTEYGLYLASIDSPLTGETLGYDQATGAFWNLYVEGEPSAVGADSVALDEQHEIVWTYGAFGSAPIKGSQSLWSAYGNGGRAVVEGVNTAHDAASLSWSANLKEGFAGTDPMGIDFVNVSDLLVDGDNVYVAVSDYSGKGVLQVRSVRTGEVKHSVALRTNTDYNCRPVIADGKLVVPEAGGALEAFDLGANGPVSAWSLEGVGSDHQCNSILSVSNGRVVQATTHMDGWNVGTGGVLRCVDLADGAVKWSYTDEQGSFYWDGMAYLYGGSMGVIADAAGTVRAFNMADGTVLGELALGVEVNAGVVALACGDEVLVVSKDGVIHKLAVTDGGGISELDSCDFASSSTSTPVVTGNTAFVGGANEGTVQATIGDNVYSAAEGTVAVIDLDDMSLIKWITDADGASIAGDVKSVTLLSAGELLTDVYFTGNFYPGGVYRWTLGDDEATVLYTPAQAQQNYCMSSVVPAADGTLLYTNDSATLFALAPDTYSWRQVDDDWMLTNGRGDYRTGWQKVAGSWYLFDDYGIMIKDAWQKVDDNWYLLGDNGAMLSGWQQVDGLWYYLGVPNDGAMKTGWQWVNGAWYYLEPSGAMATGWKQLGGKWYYLDPSGAMATGWRLVNGAWYYLYADGHMAANERTPDGYQVDASGAWIG